jgi:cytochrome b6-f complex iron-sulfur subunit
MNTSDHTIQVEKPNRREFLYYLSGASITLLTVGSIGALSHLWQIPQPDILKDFIFEVDLAKLPELERWPVAFPKGRYWLAHVDGGLLALYGVCTFMRGDGLEGCLPKWVPTNYRFECPCCGSKYHLDGTWIEGPAKRGLDRFKLEITTSETVLVTPRDGSPVSIEGATQIRVDANHLIYGTARER